MARWYAVPTTSSLPRHLAWCTHNLKMQSALYGLLIQEAFGVAVRRGYLCYVRSKHRIVELEHTEAD